MAMYNHFLRPPYELSAHQRNRAIELLLGIMLEHGDAPFAIDYTTCVVFDADNAQFAALDMLHGAGLLRSYHDIQKDKLHFKITEKGLDLCR